MADKFEKTAVGIVVFTLLVIAALLGLGIWGFVEIINWITSK